MNNAVPTGAQALPLPYEITMPLDAGFRKVPGGQPEGVHLVDLVVRHGTQNRGAIVAAAMLLGAGWTRGPERVHDQQRDAHIAEVLLDALGSRR